MLSVSSRKPYKEEILKFMYFSTRNDDTSLNFLKKKIPL